jgi:hypothetical protein
MKGSKMMLLLRENIGITLLEVETHAKEHRRRNQRR